MNEQLTKDELTFLLVMLALGAGGNEKADNLLTYLTEVKDNEQATNHLPSN